jgi:hypothetical protein
MKTSHVLLSYPLGARGLLTLFRTNTYATGLNQLIRDPGANVLVVYGNYDEFTREVNYDEWAGELAAVDRKGELKVVKVEQGTHFWRGETGRELQAIIKQWLP